MQAVFATVQELSPRPEGSQEERLLFDYIESEITARSIPYRRMDFASSTVGHSFSNVLAARLPGARDSRLAVVVPVNGRQDESVANSGDVAMAINFLMEASEELLPIGLEVVFLGAATPTSSGLGSALYVNEVQLDPPDAVVVLSNASTAEDLSIAGSTGGTVSPSWLIQRVYRAARDTGVSVSVPSTAAQFFQVAFAEEQNPITPFLNAGIPAVAIEGRPTPGPVDNRMLPLLDDLFGRFAQGMPETWDRHYLVFGGAPGGNLAIMGEETYVLMTFAAVSFLLFVGVMVRRRVDRYLHTIRRHILIIPLLLVLLTLAFLAGSGLVRAVVVYRDFPTFVVYRPVFFFAIKIFAAIAIFVGAYRVLRGRLLSRNSSFYSAAALFLLTVAVIAIAAINFSLVWYPLWALLFGLLFSLVPSRGLKIVTFLAAPLPLLAALFSGLLSGETRAAESMIVPDIWTNLLLALVSLPFLLMIIRIDLLLRHPIRGRTNIATEILAYGSTVAAVAFLVWGALYDPFDSTNPQPLAVVERIDATTNRRSLEIKSPAPIGRVTLVRDGAPLDVESEGRTAVLSLPPIEPPVNLETQSSTFLTRRRHLLRISAEPSPTRLNFRLVSESPILIYDAEFPFSMREENRVAEFEIGDSPPMPLLVELILPGDLSADALFELRWNEAFGEAYVPQSGYAMTFQTLVSTSVRLLNGGRES